MSIRVLNSKIYENGVFRPVKELDIKALCEDIEYKNCFIIPGLAEVKSTKWCKFSWYKLIPRRLPQSLSNTLGRLRRLHRG